MKKLINALFIAGSLFLLLQSFDFDGGSKRRRDGTAPGYTGSPGDSFKNCTACHGGIAVNVDGWIVSNIPSSGWEPGKRYTITATNTKMGATRFGFQVSPQAYNGTLLGEMIVTDTGATQFVGDKKYITYRAAGVDGVDSRSWSFDWIAPDSTISEVGFYGAFNSNPGHKDNDKTFLSVLKVYRAGHKSAISEVNKSKQLSVFPNPSNGKVGISFDQNLPGIADIVLIDACGKLVKTLLNNEMISNGKFQGQFDVSDVAPGLYSVMVKSNEHSFMQTLIISGN